MELSSVHIAKLVLGYLKFENCETAYSEFFKSSPYLKDLANKKKSKYIVTRILGKSLNDILHEYANIYTIIQERLECTDFYQNKNYSSKLIKQLLFLLDNTSSRSSSPNFTSRSSTPIKETEINVDISPIEEITTEINATPLKSLPGNTNNEDKNKTPKRKIPLPSSRSHRTKSVHNEDTETEKDEDNSADTSNSHIESVLQAFAQSLLEHEELQEKIAQNINTVRHPDPISKNCVEQGVENDDIDAAIKAVLQKTEMDPAFETLMGDIIDSVSDVQNLGNNINLCKASTSGNLSTLDKSTNTEKDHSASEESIDNHNNVAVLSIVTAAQEIENNSIQNKEVIPKTDVHKKLTVNTGDIILYDGTLDNYMKSSALSTPTQPPPFVVNPAGLLMINQPQNNSTQDTNLDPSKAYLVINGAQILNVTPKPLSTPPVNVLTEQDILNMPTVIVREDTDVNNKPPEKKLKTILPAKREKAQTLSDYITLYKCNDSMEISDNENIEVNIEKKSKTPDKISTENLKTTTPRHVRALDFKFQTPAKETIPIKKANSPKPPNHTKTSSKTVKTLFTSPSKSKTNVGSKKSSWDADMRALINQNDVAPPKPPPKKKRPKSVKTTKATKNTEKTKNITETIEEETTAEPKKETRALRRARANKSVKSPHTTKKTATSKENADSEIAMEIDADCTENQGVITEAKIETQNQETCNKSKDVNKTEQHVTIINCKAETNYRRKCNIDNNITKEVKITRVKEIKTLELVPETSDKMILSPSKLNANKRTLVDVVDVIPIHFEGVEKNAAEALNISKCTTPELEAVLSQMPVSNARKNIILELETPIKKSCPNTPNLFSPINTTDTPFTKVFKEQLQGVDISSIPTPKFPLTPSFPLTPLIEGQSPYVSRNTDYSTSSSYYLPSDSEQNKSLETFTIDVINNKKSNLIKSDEIAKKDQCVNSNKKELEQNKESDDKIHENIKKAIISKRKSFNANIIATKNLNLVPKKSSLDEFSSDGETSIDSDSSSDTSDSSNDDLENETVLQKTSRDDSVTRYPLRSKKTNNSSVTSSADKKNDDEIKGIISNTEFKPQLDKNKKDDIDQAKVKVLKEMEEKRKRTIASIKAETVPESNKKTIEAKNNTKTKTPAKTTNKKKQVVRKPTAKPVRRSLRSNSTKVPEKTKMSPTKIGLDLSSDEENVVHPLEMVETELLLSSNSNTPVPENKTKNPISSFENTLNEINEKIKQAFNQDAIKMIHENKSLSLSVKDVAETSTKADKKSLKEVKSEAELKKDNIGIKVDNLLDKINTNNSSDKTDKDVNQLGDVRKESNVSLCDKTIKNVHSATVNVERLNLDTDSLQHKENKVDSLNKSTKYKNEQHNVPNFGTTDQEALGFKNKEIKKDLSCSITNTSETTLNVGASSINKDSKGDLSLNKLKSGKNEQHETPIVGTSDQEAENLEEGLKKWGIHVVHNKLAVKKTEDKVITKVSESTIENKEIKCSITNTSSLTTSIDKDGKGDLSFNKLKTAKIEQRNTPNIENSDQEAENLVKGFRNREINKDISTTNEDTSATMLNVDATSLNVNSKSKTVKNEQHITPSIETSDQEAENLVKGLKEWGIHLVHNKLAVKKTEDKVITKVSESTVDVEEGEILSSDDEKSKNKSTSHASKETRKDNSRKPFRNTLKSTPNCSKTLRPESKLSTKRNQRDDKSKKIDNKSNKREISKYDKEYRRSDKRNNDKYDKKAYDQSDKKYRNQSDKKYHDQPHKKYDQSFKKRNESDKKYRDQLDKKNYDKLDLTNKVHPEAQNISKQSEFKTETIVKEQVDDYSNSDEFEEIQLKIVEYNDETIRHIIHNDQHIPPKKVYNLELLTKKINARIDDNIVQPLTVSPFIDLIDIPSKLSKSGLNTVTVLESHILPNKSKHKSNPLKILYDNIKQKELNLSKQMEMPSPLDDLYSDKSSSYERNQPKRKILPEKSSVCEKSIFKQKSEPTSYDKEKRDISDNEDVIKTEVQTDRCKSEDVIDGGNEHVEDLMDFAVCGLNKNEESNSSDGKRKADTELDRNSKKSKTDKCQEKELIGSVDVDNFLKTLHGE